MPNLMSKQSDNAFVLVCTQHYWPWVRVCLQRLRLLHPHCSYHVCIADMKADDPVSRDGVKCWRPSQLCIPEHRRFCFQYSPTELCCALKPYILRHILNHTTCAAAIYIDSDIWVERPLTKIWHALGSSNVVLSPHVPAGLPAHGQRHVLDDKLLASGPYNAGLIGVRKHSEADKFLTWWCDKMRSECIYDLPGLRFVDQIWLSLVPGLFAGTEVLHDSAYNVAFWNLPGRVITRHKDSGLRIDNTPLVCFHFTGFDPSLPQVLSHHSEFDVSAMPALIDLQRTYASELQSAGWQAGTGNYGWEKLSDGTPIRPEWRECVRLHHPLLVSADDPFDANWKPVLERSAASMLDECNHVRYTDLINTLRSERVAWKAAYDRLALAFPNRQFLWIRRVLKRITNNDKTAYIKPKLSRCEFGG